LDISIRSEDIRAQTEKVSEIAPNLACFAAKFFCGEWDRSPNVWIGIYKLNMLPNMWQNFAAIGRGTSEISR